MYKYCYNLVILFSEIKPCHSLIPLSVWISVRRSRVNDYSWKKWRLSPFLTILKVYLYIFISNKSQFKDNLHVHEVLSCRWNLSENIHTNLIKQNLQIANEFCVPERETIPQLWNFFIIFHNFWFGKNHRINVS